MAGVLQAFGRANRSPQDVTDELYNYHARERKKTKRLPFKEFRHQKPEGVISSRNRKYYGINYAKGLRKPYYKPMSQFSEEDIEATKLKGWYCLCCKSWHPEFHEACWWCTPSHQRYENRHLAFSLMVTERHKIQRELTMAMEDPFTDDNSLRRMGVGASSDFVIASGVKDDLAWLGNLSDSSTGSSLSPPIIT